MGFWTANVLLLVAAVALIPAVVSAGEVNPEDGNYASKMDQKFQQIFDRFDLLESMMKTIIRNQNELSGGSNNSGVTIGTHGANENMVTHPELVATQNQLNLSLHQVDRLQKILSDLVSIPACQRTSARVYPPMVVAEANATQNISCQSPGQAVKICLWGHNVNGTPQAILIDQQVVENGERTTLDGISYAGGNGELEAGRCTLNIGNVTEDHAGLWSCTLVSRQNATIFSGAVHLALASVNGTSRGGYQQRRTGMECEEKRMEFLTILKQVFDDGQNCAPCPKCDTTSKGMLMEAEEKLQRKQKNLNCVTALAAITSGRSKESAEVPQPHVFATLKTSQVLTCEARGQAISMCLWGKKIGGRREGIFIDQQVVQQGGQTDVGGISYVGSGLDDGKCSINIQSVTENDLGTWSCMLVAITGVTLEGEVRVQEVKPSIYFATTAGEVKSYSLETSQVSTIASPGGDLRGLAYDSMARKIYFCSSSKIGRANLDESNLETVLSTSQYGEMRSLTFDWITGNIYVATARGYILACETLRTISCAKVLSVSGGLMQALALNPTEGVMYYTTYRPTISIVRAGMDGSNPVTMVTGLREGLDIVIDFKTARLVWADGSGNTIESSDMSGGDRRTVVQPANHPYGIAIANGRIYWGEWSRNTLRSSTLTGNDIITLYTGTSSVTRLAAVPNWNLPQNRTNHCARHSCAKVCVLTATSFRCIE